MLTEYRPSPATKNRTSRTSRAADGGHAGVIAAVPRMRSAGQASRGRESMADQPTAGLPRPAAGCEQLQPASVAGYLRATLGGARHEVLALASARSPVHLHLGLGLELELGLGLGLGLERRTDPERLPRGLRMRVLLEPGATDSHQAAAFGEGFADAQSQTRVSPELSGYLVVADRSVAIVPRDAGEPAGTALVVRAPALVTALIAQFDHHWRAALPPAEPAAGQLSPVRRQILADMAAGMTDDAIARKLGICTRTVRRHVTTMMALLDARSRLELGMRAVTRGVLPER